MLHDMKIHVQERANVKKETLQFKYLMEHSCFAINEFKDNIIKDPAKNLSYGAHERKVFDAQSNSSQLGRPRKRTTFQ